MATKELCMGDVRSIKDCRRGHERYSKKTKLEKGGESVRSNEDSGVGKEKGGYDKIKKNKTHNTRIKKKKNRSVKKKRKVKERREIAGRNKQKKKKKHRKKKKNYTIKWH